MKEKFLDPKRNIELFDLKEEMKVVDLGAGAGFYVLESAKEVGPQGKVYAVDIQKDLLSKIKKEAERLDLDNIIEIVWADLEFDPKTGLKSEFADALIVTNILFQVKKKEALLEEAFRLLKKNGKMLLVDWSESFGNTGPRPQDIVNKDDALDMALGTGFSLEREIPAGAHHYGLIFRKK